MGTFALSKNGNAAASGAAFATLHTGANSCKIIEVAFFLTTAVASSIGIIKPNNTPVATTSTLLQALEDGTSTTNFDTAWSHAPTIGSNEYLYRVVLPAAVSAGYVKVWRPDRPFKLAANSWLVFWNFGGSTAGVPAISVEVDE